MVSSSVDCCSYDLKNIANSKTPKSLHVHRVCVGFLRQALDKCHVKRSNALVSTAVARQVAMVWIQ